MCLLQTEKGLVYKNFKNFTRVISVQLVQIINMNYKYLVVDDYASSSMSFNDGTNCRGFLA